MIDPLDRIHPDDIVQATVSNRPAIPLFLAMVQAGFPSPAENYIERRLDLNELCHVDSETTCFVRVAGESMNGDRIYPGDILIVDATYPPPDGSVVVVWVNGDYCVKRFVNKEPMVVLMSSNEKFLPIYVHPKRDDFKIIGVVTNVLFKPPCYAGLGRL